MTDGGGSARSYSLAGLAVTLAIAAAAAVSSGCLVASLQPAYDDGSIVFEDRLLGRWENPEDRTSVTIEAGEWRSYKITYVDRFSTTKLQGNLTQIGTVSLLDLTQARGADEGPYLIPVHGIFRIEFAGDTLTAAPLDYAWFADAVTHRRLGRLAASLDSRRNVVIASPTVEQRAWLGRAPDEAFGAAMTFTRSR